MTKNKRETAAEVRLRCMEDPRFRRWVETLRLKNRNTADSYLYSTIRLTRSIGSDPLSYVALFQEDPDAFDDATQDIVNTLVRAGRAEQTIVSGLSGLKHWSDWCRCKLGRKLVVGKAPRSPVASKQRIPAQDVLRRVLNQLDARGRACLGFRVFAGLRPGILGTTHGNDGLRLRHLEGLTVEGGRYAVEVSSLKVNVPAELSKNGRAFFTFLGGEGLDYLRAYLDRRVAGGEVLTPESPVIVPVKSCNRDGSYEFVKRETLTEPLSRAMKEAGVSESPYIWRSYFKTQLLIAQSKKGLLGEYVEFWMGHDGGIKGVYSFHKEVGDEVVAEMREAYETKALPFLEARAGSGEDATLGELHRVMLESFGVPEEVIEGLDLEGAEPEELRELMRKHRDEAVRALVQEATRGVEVVAPGVAAPVAAPVAVPMQGAARQLVVPVEQVSQYVALGWRYVYEARMPEGQALVEGQATPVSVGQARGAVTPT